MEKYKFVNLAVFILFFGTALFEAFQKQHWIEVAFFFALGLLSLWADSIWKRLLTPFTIIYDLRPHLPVPIYHLPADMY